MSSRLCPVALLCPRRCWLWVLLGPCHRQYEGLIAAYHPEMSRVESQASLTSGSDRLLFRTLGMPALGQAGTGGAAGGGDTEEADHVEAGEEGEEGEEDEEWAPEEEGEAQGTPGSGELWRGGVKRKRRSSRHHRGSTVKGAAPLPPPTQLIPSRATQVPGMGSDSASGKRGEDSGPGQEAAGEVTSPLALLPVPAPPILGGMSGQEPGQTLAEHKDTEPWQSLAAEATQDRDMDVEVRDTQGEKGSVGSVGEPLAAALASSLCFRGALQPRLQPPAPGEPRSPMEHSQGTPGLSSHRGHETEGRMPQEQAAQPLAGILKAESEVGIIAHEAGDGTAVELGRKAVSAPGKAAQVHVLKPDGCALEACPPPPCGTATGFLSDPVQHGAGALQNMEQAACLGTSFDDDASPSHGEGPGAPTALPTYAGEQLQAMNAQGAAVCGTRGASGTGLAVPNAAASVEGHVSSAPGPPLQATGLAPEALLGHPLLGALQGDAFPGKEDGEEGGAGLPLDGAQRDQILRWDTSGRRLSSQLSAEATHLTDWTTPPPSQDLPAATAPGSCPLDPGPFLSLASLMREEHKGDGA